jgi:hypothetical protein
MMPAKASIGQIQPCGELRPNKSKENQIKPNKKAWISLDFLGRIGRFQWVTTIPNKNFRLGS